MLRRPTPPKNAIENLKVYACFITILISINYCFAQGKDDSNLKSAKHEKPPIDSSVYNKWPAIDYWRSISDNGNYVAYNIHNQPAGGNTMVLQATKGNWKMELQAEPNNNSFTSGGDRFIFISHDSLGIVTPGRSPASYIPDVISFKLPANGNGEWLAYQLNGADKKLTLRNLRSGKEKSYSSVNNYLFSENGNLLVLQTEKDSTAQTVTIVTLPDCRQSIIWQGTAAGTVVINREGTQVAFIAENKPGEKSIWHFKKGTDSAVLIASNQSPEMRNEKIQIDDITNFSKEGDKLFFGVTDIREPLKPLADPVALTVWSYTDTKLQSRQQKELNETESYTAVIHLRDRRIVRLAMPNEIILNKDIRSYAIIRHIEPGAEMTESGWNTASMPSYFLVSTRDGTRKQIAAGNEGRGGYDLSPEEKYVIYYCDKGNYPFYSYEIATGIIRNISDKAITDSWFSRTQDNDINLPRWIAGWLENDEALLMYDSYDIWQLDPTGKKAPVNLTNGYGQKHHILFCLGLEHYTNEPISLNEGITLNAFNLDTKENGFFRVRIKGNSDPELLAMGPYFYHFPAGGFTGVNKGEYPIKARSTDKYLLRRCNAEESPNFFYTADFRQYTRLSNLKPEKDYNWYTTELHTWKALDGKEIQGILYKPENFDPGKKYPVIFHYYERKSNGLHAYLPPEPLNSGCAINIPTFVSNGYLVFTPDIYYTMGDPMQGAFDAVASAAGYISQLSFVDSTRMGLQGCSFGGIETNYLVTHTNIFKAACSASGLGNFISDYGSVGSDGRCLQDMFEYGGQIRMGGTLWQIPDLYIKNSAIFNADKVTTPFLLMHTTKDGVCNFSQAIELFTALRRLRKKAWLLEYTNGNHGIWGKSGYDFSIRMQQFFDHYLKNKPAPKWMTQGIPAKMKGVLNGLELDHYAL
ncbi:MAG TPA: prolyl oligopeptidase family serine peptidase [Chitinophaga sp.]|uniref:alpha/beta hydrolase family protein n=1 Tax=Chitinophaga sp. TaxID=1869181 RepID=UPI002CB02D0C|nr:prolyl oligopeptidase family serine peptidase [Chitinophaga sp.]HVI45846.1 prolyl oligopeptidase family serine peptidase [Chitinophaga sp.]